MKGRIRGCNARWLMRLSIGLLVGLSSAVLAMARPALSITSEYAYRRYTTQDGLPQMLTECIYQDRKGYIWIGTLSGFVRYDGFEFKPFLKGEQENILAFQEIDNGKILALSFRRKHIVDKEGMLFTVSLADRDLLLNNFNSSSLPPGYLILENEQEKEREICRLVGNEIKPILKNDLLDRMDITRKVYLDQARKIFYIPTENRVYRLRADGGLMPGIDLPNVFSLLETNSRLLLFAANGIYEFIDGKTRLVLRYRFPAPDYGLAALADRKGNIFIHDAHNIYRLSVDGRFERLADGINLIKQMFIDREGNLWIATYQGVYNFFQMNLQNHVLSDKNDILRAIGVDRDHLLIGTLNGSLLRWQARKEVIQVPYPHSEDNYFLPYTARIGETIFFLGKGDVMAYEQGRFRKLGLPYRNYQYLCADNGRLLIATREELLIADTEGRVLREEKGLRGLFCAREDSRGNIYLGTAYGLVRLNGEERKEIVLPDGDRICTAMTVTPFGKVLFASGKNLYSLRSDSAILLQSYGNLIRSIRQTRDNYLVVSVLDGLYITDNRLLQTMFFNQYNGFTGIEPLLADIAETDDGMVWVPCVNQTVSFRPKELVYQYTIPQLELVSAEASVDNVSWKRISPREGRTIELDHELRHWRFSFIAVSHSATGNIRYRYRLKGFQQQWSRPQVAREIQFNNLSPGRYELEVVAEIGNLVSEPIHLAILLRSAFWQRWWFWMIAGLLLSEGIWGLAYGYYKRRDRVNVRRLEREIKLNNLLVKSIRLKSIPHFNANVLAGIEYYMMNNSVTEANKYLALYSRFTNATLFDVDKPSRSLDEEIKYVRLYLSLEQLRYGENLLYTIDVGEGVETTIQVPNMILHTYCENAIKHGLRNKPGQGHVCVEVTNRGNGINIAVADDGVGRAVAATLSTASTKQGLSIMEQQIELYNQRNSEHITQTVTDLKDEEGRACGTRFELYVPRHFNYF